MNVTVDQNEAKKIEAFIQKASKAGYSEDEIKQSIEKKYAKPADNYQKTDPVGQARNPRGAQWWDKNNPTDGMSRTELALAGTGKAFVDAGRGAGQLAGDIAEGVGMKRPKWSPTAADIDFARNLDAPLMDTAQGSQGNFAGNVATFAPLALVPGANTISGGALLGGGAGAVQPLGTGESRTGNVVMGGGAGAVVPGAIRSKRVIQAALVDPFTQAGNKRIVGSALNSAASNRAQAMAAMMRNQRGATPGFFPTAGQASMDDGIASLERAAQAVDPGGFQSVREGQMSSLVDALRGVAKTPEAREAALQARKQATTPLYAQTQKSTQLADPTRVVNLIDRMTAANPANKSLVSPLNQVRNSLFEEYPSTQRGADAWKVLNSVAGKRMSSADSDAVLMARKLMDRVKKGVITPDDAVSQIGSLNPKSKTASEAIDMAIQYMKTPDNVLMQKPQHLMSAMDNIKSLLGNQENAFVKRELTTVKKALGHQINKVEPTYGQAEQTFAKMSQPINQMDIGQELYKRFIPALADDGAVPFRSRANSYAEALRNGDQLAKKTTGMKGATLEGTMTPEQLAVLRGVSTDASMVARAQGAGRGVGSDTVQKLAMSNLMTQAGVPNWMQGIARVPGGWLKTLGDIVYTKNDEAIRAALSEIIKDPAQAAQAMQMAKADPSGFVKMLQTVSQGAALSLPSAVNAGQQ